jgi:hypothetical protein
MFPSLMYPDYKKKSRWWDLFISVIQSNLLGFQKEALWKENRMTRFLVCASSFSDAACLFQQLGMPLQDFVIFNTIA